MFRRLAEEIRGALTVPGHPAVAYGLTCGVGIAAPLVAGALTGHAPAGGSAGLGAFLVALTQLEGPYGARARILLTRAVLVAGGVALGGALTGVPQLGVLVVGALGFAMVAVPYIGPPPVIAVIFAMLSPSPPPGTLGLHVALTLAGGGWISLLLLSPWPFRRLKPLREALADAGEAVAGALSAAVDASEAEWARTRLATSDAVRNARTACAMAAGRRSRDGPRDCERLTALYTRIFHEAAALRGLTAAARTHPTAIDWAERLRETVVRLAQAVQAVAREGRQPGDPREAAQRFADRARKVRRAAHAGHEELAAAVLLGQMRRCVERIAVAVRTAAGIGKIRVPLRAVGGGPLRVVGRRPSMPEPAVLRHAGRVAVAATTAVALAVLFAPGHGQWLVVTVLLSLQQTYGDTVSRVFARTAGTAAGATIAASILFVAPGHLVLALILLVLAAAAFAVRTVNHAQWQFLATPLILVLGDFSRVMGWPAAAERIGLTLAGCVLALIAARLLWPRGAEAEVPELASGLLVAHAELVRALADFSDHDGREDAVGGEDAVRERYPMASAAADDLRDALDRMDKEPRGRAPDALRDAITYARRIRDRVMTLSAVLRFEPVRRSAGPSPRSGDPDPRAASAHTGPTPAILDAIADRLDTCADAVLMGRPGPPVEDLKELVADLGTRVERLTARRLDEVADGTVDEFTSVRVALMHAAGTVDALRELTEDAVRLCVAVSRWSP